MATFNPSGTTKQHSDSIRPTGGSVYVNTKPADYKIENGKIVKNNPSTSTQNSGAFNGEDTLTIIEKDTGKVIRQGTSSSGTGLPSVTGNGNIPTGTVSYTPDSNLNASKGIVGIGISTISGQPSVLKDNPSVVNIDSNKSGVVVLDTRNIQEIKEKVNPVQTGVITGLTGLVNVLPVPFKINDKGEGNIDLLKPVNFVSGLNPFVGAYNLFSGNAIKEVENSFKAGESIANKMTPETRETVTSLGLVGGGLFVAGAAPAIGGGLGVLGGTTGFVSTAIGTPGVTKAVVRTGASVVSPDSVLVSFDEQKAVGKEMFSSIEQKVSSRGIQLPFVGSTDAIAYGLIPGAGLLGDNPETAIQRGKEYFISKGDSAELAERKARQVWAIEGIGGGAGEIAAIVPGGIVGEYFGQKTVSSAFGKAVNPSMSVFEKGKLAERIARTRLGIAGAIEAPTLYSAQSIARNQDITPEGLLVSAAVGGVGAGYIGGKIVKWSYTNPKLASAAVNVVRLTNPDESFGDFGYTVGKLGNGSKIVVPSISFTSSDGLSGINTKSIYRAPIISFTPSSTSTMTTSTKSIYSTPSIVFTPSNTFTPTITPSPTTSSTITNTPIFTSTPSITETPTTTITPTPTSTITFTPTYTPTVTLPFIPLGGGLGLNADPFSSGRGARGKRKYYDEWEAALGILNRQQPVYVQKANKIRVRQENKLIKQELKRTKQRQVKQGQLFVPKFIRSGFL